MWGSLIGTRSGWMRESASSNGLSESGPIPKSYSLPIEERLNARVSITTLGIDAEERRRGLVFIRFGKMQGGRM